ncbi:MAG TPA: helix-turn-helix transcriptional regulator [Bacteroidales bacterium]|nr:MAG: helix-turn-helix protein [Bacteroidetes bacterium ADurb.Bin217]HPH16065.1 helix-turn-helix transcriptional regulator [Bacteroidales bacterium]
MDINNNILLLNDANPYNISMSIAARIKERRLEQGYTQKKLASLSGIPLPTYRRLEQQGEISLRSLILIAIALDMEADFNQLFSATTYTSIDDVLQKSSKKRKRGIHNR